METVGWTHTGTHKGLELQGANPHCASKHRLTFTSSERIQKYAFLSAFASF